MSKLSMRIDGGFADVERFVSGIEKNLRPDAVVPAINKTAAFVKTRVVRKIAQETGTKQKTFNKKIKIIKARKATAKMQARNFATVDANEAVSINLIEYVAPGKRKIGYFNEITGTVKGKRRYRARGVKARVGGKMLTYRGAFIGTDSRGQMKVFRRIGTKMRGKRQNITQVPGPSPKNWFSHPESHRFMRDHALQRFPIELDRAVQMLIARQQRKK